DPEAPAPVTTTTTVAVAERPAGEELDLEGFRALWPAVLDAVRTDNQLLGAILSEARPVELRAGEVVIAFDDGQAFNRRKADGRANRAMLECAIRALHGAGVRVCFELRSPEQSTTDRPPTEDELVARFVTEFDAEEIVPDPQPEGGGS
ncbi:MAG TPA: hypothetical protein VGJ70_18450, partial [Solirubrobacteraceae bacterium]